MAIRGIILVSTVSVYGTGQEKSRSIQQNDKFTYCGELYKIITETN